MKLNDAEKLWSFVKDLDTKIQIKDKETEDK